MKVLIIILFATLNRNARAATPGATIGNTVSTTTSQEVAKLSPMDKRITIRLPYGHLPDYFDAIEKQSGIRFFVSGPLHCEVSAFLRDVPAREAIQLALQMKGLTILADNEGLKGLYIVTAQDGVPACPAGPRRRSPSHGSCCPTDCDALSPCSDAKIAESTSFICKDATLAGFAATVFDHSKASFFLGNGTGQYPISARLTGTDMEPVAEEILAGKSLSVKRFGTSRTFLLMPQ
jgi:hypothetical protein